MSNAKLEVLNLKCDVMLSVVNYSIEMTIYNNIHAPQAIKEFKEEILKS